ncbi:MAG TPA: tetraacyldisaccharide 4'-kinase [Lacipirellulaceae bacterium]|nr:tetraacyldisaccharide 4'-kinase [Lacipirellulaceae bacterium]
MISPSTFHDLVSGRRRGPAAALARVALRAAAAPYGWAIARRNRQFDRQAVEIARPSVPVISVGNLTVGGTGKTPMVQWVAALCRRREVRVAILSRGYGAAADGRNDEALELELALPDVPHLQNPNRAESAMVAVGELGSQLLLLDDGFQHRRLARDFDIVLLDASEPFGYGRLLPAGLLREPVGALARAHAVVLSRADMLDAAGRDAIRRRVAALNPHAAWCEVEHRPAALVSAEGVRAPRARIEDDGRGTDAGAPSLAGKRVAAFCGIGNPAGFRHTLRGLGCEVLAWREFPDHHAYQRDDVESITAWARDAGAELVLCTRKDLVKLRAGSVGGVPLRAVGVELQFLRGAPELTAALEPLIRQAIAVPDLADV